MCAVNAISDNWLTLQKLALHRMGSYRIIDLILKRNRHKAFICYLFAMDCVANIISGICWQINTWWFQVESLESCLKCQSNISNININIKTREKNKSVKSKDNQSRSKHKKRIQCWMNVGRSWLNINPTSKHGFVATSKFNGSHFYSEILKKMTIPFLFHAYFF